MDWTAQGQHLPQQNQTETPTSCSSPAHPALSPCFPIIGTKQIFLNLFCKSQQSIHQMLPRVKLNTAFYLE